MLFAQAVTILVLVLVHLLAGRLRFLDGIPRSRWLSFAGGISVAYVFVHIFPELAEVQQHISASWEVLDFVEHHAYLVAMGGLGTFYGLERMVKVSRTGRGHPKSVHPAGEKVFWIHIASFAVYNALVGYLLVEREESDLGGIAFYGIAMAMHFVVNDFGLQQAHRETYRRFGRWVLAASIVVGWAIGIVADVHEGIVSVLFAFLAGGIVLNVLKEELPEERKSRFLPFILGACFYAALLIVS